MISLKELHREIQIRSPRPDAVRVVAVSKLQTTAAILKLADEGQENFGENYLQEFLEKAPHLSNHKLIWHYIGEIQSKKISKIVAAFDWIHSVESVDHLLKMEEKCIEQNRTLNVLIQLNLASEASKGGIFENELESLLVASKKFEKVQIKGLMTMPPLQNQPEENRIYFKRLKQILSNFQNEYPKMRELSMGTSSDFQVALEEGSTMIRLGTILFGNRSKK